MNTFKNLEIDKQRKIINAAMSIFASNGYKKAYMSEIANRADVSKATLFYYFKSKLNLYEYLVEVSYKNIKSSIDNQKYEDVDFFDGLELISNTQIQLLQTWPSIIKFTASIYTEYDPEVYEIKNEFIKSSKNLQRHILETKLDSSKFKAGIKPEVVIDLLQKWSEGYMATLEKQSSILSDEEMASKYSQMQTDFAKVLKLLKDNLYEVEEKWTMWLKLKN